MHPILASGRRRALYLALWLPFAGALHALLMLGAALEATLAGLLALPISFLYAAISLGTYYLCRAIPVRLAQMPRVIVTHLAAATVSAALVAAAGGLLVRGARSLGLTPGERSHPAAVLFGVGLLVFLLAAALHYVLLGYQASREAERRALEFQLLSRDAELKTLRAQIHPHFLFNALNSISALTGRDPAAARRVCNMLGDFLRNSLALGAAEAVPLAQELALAEALLNVERVRFGERLRVVLEIEEAARGCWVPPLILQPLVENAVTHGIAGLLEGGTVSLRARLQAGRLELCVENPRDPEARRRLDGAGIGLDNVRRRLQALYGDEADVRLDEAPDSFAVTLRLPARR
jgi:two-component system, LytTR family, sensor histidine kinase AlgZ